MRAAESKAAALQITSRTESFKQIGRREHANPSAVRAHILLKTRSSNSTTFFLHRCRMHAVLAMILPKCHTVRRKSKRHLSEGACHRERGVLDSLQFCKFVQGNAILHSQCRHTTRPPHPAPSYPHTSNFPTAKRRCRILRLRSP